MTEDEFDTHAGVGHSEPAYRATIRNGRVMLTHWADWLVTGGMWNEVLDSRRRAGVAIADLTLTGDEDSELIVRFLSEGRSREDADAALCRWARRVGYCRVWLPDRVVTLDPEPEVSRRAEVRCRICGSRWHDSTPEFWQMVRGMGTFPKWCVICGWELPQWEIAPEKPRKQGTKDSPVNSTDSASTSG